MELRVGGKVFFVYHSVLYISLRGHCLKEKRILFTGWNREVSTSFVGHLTTNQRSETK